MLLRVHWVGDTIAQQWTLPDDASVVQYDKGQTVEWAEGDTRQVLNIPNDNVKFVRWINLPPEVEESEDKEEVK